MKTALAFMFAACSLTAADLRITQQQLGSEWPLTVKEGVLGCFVRGPLKAVTFTTNGTLYAVNGGALTLKVGPDIERITLPGERVLVKDPKTGKQVNVGPRLKSVGPLIDRGLKLCP